MSLPLDGIRVLAFEQYGAGPWATMQLADLGADVIKVEDPVVGGDVSRYVPPYQEGEESLFFETFNRNKRSVSLDMRVPQSRVVLDELIRNVDVIFSNLRGDLPAKLGIRYADVAAINPHVVVCSLSGYGLTGPRAAEGAYDFTIQGLAGWQSVTGGPDGPPIKSGLSLVDYSAGYVAALAILAGLRQSERDGRGCELDLSLFETALSQLAYLGTWVASRGYVPERQPHSAHQSMVPFQNFQTADGWIVVACPKQGLWVRLCDAIDQTPLALDPRFASAADRFANRAELVQILTNIFSSATTQTWLDRLVAEGVPCAPVNDIEAALADPQTVARGDVISVSHPTLGDVRQLRSPMRFVDRELPARRGPFRGEHTFDVLRDLCGISADHVEELAAAGAFGDLPSTATGSRARV